jgi:tRNA1(Val) A37 N6-methylase TrmN6
MKQTGVKVGLVTPAHRLTNWKMELKTVLLPFGKTIYQTEQGQLISSDNSHLVDLLLQRETEILQTVLDLGCGNGILSLMLAHYRPAWKITGIEIQPHLVELAQKNCLLTEAVNVDIKLQDMRCWRPEQVWDIIVCNPPYHPLNSGILSPVKEKAISRHELCCNMLDVLTFIKGNLKLSGKAYVIYASNRSSDLEKFTKKVDLNINRRFSFKKNRKKSIIFSLTQMV